MADGVPLVLTPRAYRWVDRLTKLGGVALVAVGFEVGGHTPAGIVLGLCGAMLALSTVFVEPSTAAIQTTDE